MAPGFKLIFTFVTSEPNPEVYEKKNLFQQSQLNLSFTIFLLLAYKLHDIGVFSLFLAF